MGGREVANRRRTTLSSAELWWRGSSSWTWAEELPVRVFGSSAVSLEGAVYLTGGQVYLSTQQEEDPGSGVLKYEEGAWRWAGNMSTTRYYHAITTVSREEFSTHCT